MSDDFEDLLKRWLRDRSRTDRSTLQALAGNVAALPPRRRNRPSRLLPLAASIVVLLGAIAFLAPRLGNVGGEADPTVTPSAETSQGSTLPGGPEAFAGDPRLPRCYITGRPNQMEYVFEITRDQDYGLFLPNPGQAPDLDADDSALVVVYRQDMPPLPDFGPGTGPPATNRPGYRIVCVVLEPDDLNEPALIQFGGLDISGLDIDALPIGPTHRQASESPPPLSSPTPTPASGWTAGAKAALGCDGRPAESSRTGGVGSSTRPVAARRSSRLPNLRIGRTRTECPSRTPAGKRSVASRAPGPSATSIAAPIEPS